MIQMKTFALVNNLFHSDPLLAWPQTSFAGCQTDSSPDTSAFNSTKKPHPEAGFIKV